MRAFTRFFETKPDSPNVYTHTLQCCSCNLRGFSQRYAEAIDACHWYRTTVPALASTLVEINPSLAELGGCVYLAELRIELPVPAATGLLHEVGHITDFCLGNRAAYMREARRTNTLWTTASQLATEARATRFAGRVLPLSRLEAADLAAGFTTYLLTWRQSKSRAAMRALNRLAARAKAYAFTAISLPDSEVLETNEFFGLAGTGLASGVSKGHFGDFKKVIRSELTEFLGPFYAESYISTLEEFMVHGNITR